MPPTVAEISVALEAASNRDFRYRSRLFNEIYGSRPVDSITVLDLLAYREKVAKAYAPWTAHEYLSAAKRIVLWAASVGLRPPINLDAVKGIKPKPQPRKTWDCKEINRLLLVAGVSDPRAAAYMRLQYLTAARPSEAVRMALGQYETVTDCVILMDESKTDQPRYLVLSEGAKQALDAARSALPKRRNRSLTARPWSRLDSYSRACYMACGKRPHLLRHSAATSLLSKGVDRRDVDEILGHQLANRISVTYMGIMAQEYEKHLPAIEKLQGDLDE